MERYEFYRTAITQYKEKQRTEIKEPHQYNVVMHNDDFTTMEFVIMVLKQIFFHTDEKATALMLQIHHSEKAVVGTYTYDIAASKVRKAIELARANNFPLRITIENE